jgi:hypothetical protein
MFGGARQMADVANRRDVVTARGAVHTVPDFKTGGLVDSEIRVAHTSAPKGSPHQDDASPAQNQRLSAEVSVDPSGVIAVS